LGNQLGRTWGAKKARRVRITAITHTMPAAQRRAVPAGVREEAGCAFGGIYPFNSLLDDTAGATDPAATEGFLDDFLGIGKEVWQS
jgi:hypothetical protein